MIYLGGEVLKRSEMLKIIATAIDYVDNSKENLCIDEEVLKSIEEAGMKAPPIKKTNQNTGLFNGTDSYEWEPEEKGKLSQEYYDTEPDVDFYPESDEDDFEEIEL